MKSPKQLRKKIALGLMVGVVGIFHCAYALPQIDGTAPVGVTIASDASTMNIGSTAPNNVLNWKTFSIGETEKVAFDARNYLNLVTGTEASSILGQLTGGGNVYLINPNGILFGANAKVDVGSFYASTRNIADVNTAAFAENGTNPLLTTVNEVGGDIINRGTIAANQIVLEGGHISIQNYENIQNSAGEVLNSDAVTLKATESGNIHVGYNITKYRYDNNINMDYDYDGNYAATSTMKKNGVDANGMYYWGTSQENNHPTFNYAATTLDGTAITATPYALIHNIYEWENLNQVSWGSSNFMLANDIDGTNYTYTPITSFDARTPHLDGLGYTIKNLSYEAVSGGSPAGLFITLKDATMENLNIASSTSFKAYQEDVSAGWRHAGSLAYETKGNVLLRNVHSSANVTNGRTIGGLVAFNQGGGLTIMDSSFDGTVTGSSDVGGLVGSHAGSSIYDTGKLTIKNSYNTGSISYDTTNASTSDALHMGGLVGNSAGGLSIVNSYNTGTIDSSAAENITGSVTYVGGLAGYVNQTRGKDNYTIEKSYNTGDVIAYNPNSESYAFAGGLFGYYQNDSDTALAISEVYNAGNVKAQATAVNGTKGNRAIGAYAGGVIGYSKGSDGSSEEALTIKNAYAAKLAGGATAAVTISGGTKGSGGIIGFVDGADGKTGINSSYWYSSAGMGAYGDRITTDGNDSLAGSQYITVNTASGNLDYASALAAYKADSGSNPNPNARDTYTALGWDIGNNGGESTVWRIFNLHTPPMLRTFLKPKLVAANVTVTKEYNGTAQSVNYSDLNALGIYGDTTGSLGSTTFGSQTNAGTTTIGYNDNYPSSLSALTWSGQDGVDYDDITFTITPKAVSASFDNPTKVYDGTATASTANPTLTGLISSDSGNVGVSATSAAYDDKNAGTNKTVTYTGLTLTGDKAANYVLTKNAVTGTGTITQKELTASVEAISKTYDGTTNATAPTPTLTGVVAGDSVSASASGSYDSKDVGSRTVNYTLSLSGNDAANYSLASTTTGKGTISQKVLTASVDAITKVYDGTTNAAAPTPTLTGVVAGDNVSVNASGSYDSKNVGSYTINYTLGLTGADAANYSLASTTATGNGSITQKALTASVAAISKTYDGTTNATAPAPTLTGVVEGDNVSVSASGIYDSRNAGSRTVNYNLSLSGNDAANYSLASTTTGIGTISQKELTASVAAISKTYDGTTNATAPTPTLTGVVAGDSVSASASGSYDSKDVGSYTINYTMGLTGADAANYSLASTSATGNGTITQKALTASVDAISKTYDGTTNATAPTPTLTGVVAGDNVSVSANGSYDSKNVGDRTVNYTLTLAGTDAANYSLASTTTGEGTISQKELTASVDAISKVYDGTTDATAPTLTLTGVVEGDNVSVSASGSYDSKNAGSRTVNYSLSLTGEDAGNYSLASTAVGEGTIRQKELTASVDAITKIYDGTTNAAVPTPTLTGVVAGDNVSVSASGSYDSKNAGSRTVNYSLSLNGADAANYSLDSTTATGNGTITQKELTASVDAISKTYDGTTDAAVTTPTLIGVVAGDKVSVSASGSYDSKNAGSRTVNYTLSLSGTDAGNYSLASTATGMGTISLRPVILTAEAAEIIRGEAIPELTGSADNLVTGEPAPTWSTTATSSSRSGQYAIIGTLDSSIAGNYEITQAAGNATALTIKFNPDMPDGPTPEEPTIIPTEPSEVAKVLADRNVYRNNPVNIGQDAASVAAEESAAPIAPQATVAAEAAGEGAPVITVAEESGTHENITENTEGEEA